MKTHIHKIGLCIGLLSFNIFSSCVNTNQELGGHSMREKMGWTGGNWNRFEHRHPYIAKGVKGVVGLGLAGITIGGIYGIYTVLRGNELNPGMNNDGNITTIAPLMSTSGNESTIPSNINTTTNPQYLDQLESNVTNAIDEGNRKWGNSTR
ncbi:hypothetical protein [Cardinium endosymbiont of Philonthus spinipes]|uniref:hypothetical protein n=1 Tax=Cardinium endosymbiont of Philonthus spinipes TaxID=3077941 RepID=UPI00313C66DF